MASGRLILPLSEPAFNSTGFLVTGATLTVYDTGTANLSALFSDAGLTTGIANPQTSNSAGRFYSQATVIWADDSIAYDCVLTYPDGETFTFDQIYVLGAQSNVSAFAPIASPVFTGVPEAPSPASNDNSNNIATTQYVQQQAYAPLNAPVLTGVPEAPTATLGTDTTQLATTAFVAAAILSTAATITSAGTYTFPGGLILKWGVTASHTQSDGVQAITFPVDFPTACFNVLATSGGTGTTEYNISVGSIGINGFSYQLTKFGSNDAGEPTNWLAIGN